MWCLNRRKVGRRQTNNGTTPTRAEGIRASQALTQAFLLYLAHSQEGEGGRKANKCGELGANGELL